MLGAGALEELILEDEIMAAVELAGAEEFAPGFFEPELPPPPHACSSMAITIIEQRKSAVIKNPDEFLFITF